MLKDYEVHPLIPAADLQRARAFYADKLGLIPVREDPGGLFYKTPAGHTFRITRSPNAGTAKHTVAGWSVPDVVAEVAELRAKGVVFEEYDIPGVQVTAGIAQMPAGRGAWFKDSEGNIIGIVELDPFDS